MDTHLRVQTLLQQEGRSVLREPQHLKLLIAPIIAHNREEQQKFYRVFEEYLAEVKASADRRLQQRKEEAEELEEQIRIVKRNTLPIWLVGGLLALILLIGLLGILSQTQERKKPYFSVKTANRHFFPDTSQNSGRMVDTLSVQGEMQEMSFLYQEGESPAGLQIHKMTWNHGNAIQVFSAKDSFPEIVPWTPDTTGPFWVSLTVEYADAEGNIDHKETDHFHARIQVGCRPLVLPNFTWVQSKGSGDTVSFKVDSTSAKRFSLEWDLGDGSEKIKGPSSITHTYATGGDFLVSLQATLKEPSPYNCQNYGETQHIISVDSNQPKTELASDQFPLKKDNQGSLSSQLSDLSLLLISVGITLLLLLIALLLRLWFHRKELQKHETDFAIEEESPFTIPFPSQDHLIAPEKGIYDLASVMRQRRIGNIQQINLPISIRETIRESGLPIIAFDTYSRPSEYLILIDQRHPESHLARFFGRITEILEGEDVLLDTFYYDQDPRNCWNADYPDGLSLEQLQQRYSKHRLILFTDAHRLIDPYDAILHPWFAPLFRIWKENRLILTPVPVTDWGYRERELLTEIDVLPLDIPAQMYMIEMFDEIGQPSFQEHKQRMLATFPAAGHSISEHDLDSIEGLRDYLGPQLFPWVAACSVYPLPTWEITLAIGHGLSSESETYLLTYEHLLTLARIPWLQSNELPLRLRLQLLESLDPDTERLARQAVLDLLDEVQVRPSSFIAHKVAIQQVTHQFFLTPGDKEIAEQMYYLMQQDKLANPVVRKRLEQNLDLLEGENAKNYLHQRFGAVRPREMLIAGGLGLLLSWLLFTWMGMRQTADTQDWDLKAEIADDLFLDQQLAIDSAVIWNNLAVDQAEEAQNLSNAKKLITRAIIYRKEYPLADSNLNSAHYRLGVKAFNQQSKQQYLEAITHFSRIKQEAGQNAYLWSLGGRGLAYYHLEELDYALRYVKELILLDSTFAQTNFAYLLLALNQHQASYDAYIAQAQAFFRQEAYLSTVVAADSALAYRATDSLALILRSKADSLYQIEFNFVPFENPNYVEEIVFSPDGNRILTASRDQTARLWDVEGHLLQEFTGHTDWVRSVAFSPDGQRILTGSKDKTARLRDLQGNLIQTFSEQNDLSSVAFSPDGKHILTSNNKTARLWDLQGNLIQEFKGHRSYILSVAFSPDGKYVLTGSNDNTALLWNLQGKVLQEIKGHTYRILSVAFSPDGKRILTGSESPDNTARMWDLQGNSLQTFRGHTSSVSSAVFSPDGKQVLTGSLDKTAMLWDLQGNPRQKITDLPGRVSSVVFSPNGSTFAIAGGDFVVLRSISLQEFADQIPLPTMIRIPGGTFLMGSEDGDQDEQPVHPVHPVTVSDFYMARTEITNEQYAAFLTAKGSEADSVDRWIHLGDSRIQQNGNTFSVEVGFENHPTAFVSWYGATAYCRWLSETTGQTWRLPTEAEWEYAAGGGSLGRDSAGNRLFVYAGSDSADLVAWYDSNSDQQTHPVASKAPNELGLYDMSGNLIEWCQDWYGEDYYTNSPDTNPQGPENGDYRVLRGGSWSFDAQSLRVASRLNVTPDGRYLFIGFRPIRIP